MEVVLPVEPTQVAVDPDQILVDADPTMIGIAQRVRLRPLRVADEPKGAPRWLPAFAPVSEGPR